MKEKLSKFNFSPYFPFDVSRWPFFYGWIILFAGVFGVLMSLPGQTAGIGAFTNHLMTNYRIDRVSLTFAYSVGTIISGFLVSYVGRMYDKVGVRPIAILAALILAGTLVILSQLDRIAQFFTSFIGSSHHTTIILIMLIPLFLFLRLSGQGVTTLISRNMVMKWFETRRGFANIFLGIIITLGFNATPKIFDDLIQSSSWRVAWLGMALFLATVYILVIIFFFRDNPQSLGLRPDGALKPNLNKKGQSLFVASEDFTLKEARRTREFWLYSFILALLGLFFTGFTMNYESIFTSQGLTKELALQIFILSGFCSLGFQLAGNWISDFVSLKYFLPLAAAFILVNILSVPFLGNKNLYYYIFIISLGANSAFFGIFSAITWPRLFGTLHLGEISGYSIGIIVISSALGPFLMSLSQKYLQSYHPSFYLCAAAGLILFILSFTARDERTIKRK